MRRRQEAAGHRRIEESWAAFYDRASASADRFFRTTANGNRLSAFTLYCCATKPSGTNLIGRSRASPAFWASNDRRSRGGTRFARNSEAGYPEFIRVVLALSERLKLELAQAERNAAAMLAEIDRLSPEAASPNDDLVG